MSMFDRIKVRLGSKNVPTENHLPVETAVVQALISEIWMMVDYVAGSPSQGLGKVVVANPRAAGVNLTPAELLQQVSDTERRLAIGEPPQNYDRAAMQIVRDALNLLIYPASGLTVAYTTMVAGPLRGRAASRFSLAKQAYSNLVLRAFGHRNFQRAILVLAILVTGMAVWESAKVALGKALLQNLDVLRSQQTSLSAEKTRLELSQEKTTATIKKLEEITKQASLPLGSYRLCDRALVLHAMLNNQDLQEFVEQAAKDPGPRLLAYETAEERDVCGRDDILRVNLGIVHQDLTSYSQNWPGMVGSGFAAIRNILHCLRVTCADTVAVPHKPGQDDVEFRVAPVLLVWGNFVLPIIFGLIGSSIFVTLDHYNKIRDSMLHPRDYFLAPVRLALGLVVGACIGLFFSAYGPVTPSPSTPAASALVSSLTLTASGVAFLAGFGVETVFMMLQALINRLFTMPAASK